MHSKIKLNLKVTIKDKFDKNKQVRALMPSLIHSLDATCLSLLYEEFINSFNLKNVTQFFSVHGYFGTTCDKVYIVKTILASVYTDLYSSDPYLYKFDKSWPSAKKITLTIKWIVLIELCNYQTVSIVFMIWNEFQIKNN